MCLVIPEKLAARGSVSHGNPVDGSFDTAWVPMYTSTQSRHEQLAGRCVLGYAGVLFQSRGGSASESPFASDAGEATSPIRGAHILWAGKRVSSGRLELGFSPAWLAKNPRLADIQ